MKKVAILGITLLWSFLMGCSSAPSQATPEETVDALIKAEQKMNYNTWNKLWSKPDSFYKWQFENIARDSKSNTYEILYDATKISGDEAVVYVKVVSDAETEECFAELSKKDNKWYVNYTNF